MSKKRDLAIITLIYLLAYILGFLACARIENIMYAQFVFDVVATVVTFVFSTLYRNSSVYDPYWSLTPMVMIVWLFWTEKAFNPFQILFFFAFNMWGVRLTLNWIKVFTDFTYEDWRYKKYREESPKLLWPFVNFFGIHFMPTVLVFLGMLPIYEIAKGAVGIKSLPGILIMLLGVALELFADRAMHKHLSNAKSREVCKEGLWKYSRHPNYLGEITFWVGVLFSMLPYAMGKWSYGIGALGIMLLFNFVSIPLMEKRQLMRREDYKNYCEETSRLLIRL